MMACVAPQYAKNTTASPGRHWKRQHTDIEWNPSILLLHMEPGLVHHNYMQGIGIAFGSLL
jgi:hypothetical protein